MKKNFTHLRRKLMYFNFFQQKDHSKNNRNKTQTKPFEQKKKIKKDYKKGKAINNHVKSVGWLVVSTNIKPGDRMFDSPL